MDIENHPDPFQEAMNHGLRRGIQVASSVMTGAQVYVYLRRLQARSVAERDEQARRALAAQIRAERDAARAGWSPALDRDWLRQVGLFRTAQAWGAAMPFADRATPWYEPAAATAMRRCEERLRELHPRAMARYDRLRGEGMTAADAMREAALLFGQAPRAHDAPYAARPVLDPGNGENPPWNGTEPVTGPGEPDGPAAAAARERRGRQIISAIQEQARAQGREPLGEAEQRTVLETVTNLPAEVIDLVVRPGGGARQTTARSAATRGTATRTARAERAARPWELDFPMPVRDVVAAATGNSPAAPQPAASPSPAAAPARQPARRGQSGP